MSKLEQSSFLVWFLDLYRAHFSKCTMENRHFSTAKKKESKMAPKVLGPHGVFTLTIQRSQLIQPFGLKLKLNGAQVTAVQGSMARKPQTYGALLRKCRKIQGMRRPQAPRVTANDFCIPKWHPQCHLHSDAVLQIQTFASKWLHVMFHACGVIYGVTILESTNVARTQPNDALR